MSDWRIAREKINGGSYTVVSISDASSSTCAMFPVCLEDFVNALFRMFADAGALPEEAVSTYALPKLKAKTASVSSTPKV